ncbi:hypothetical protein DSECCO2_485110 [anaerobic digester metagenome]
MLIPVSDNNSLAVVDLMLNNLGCPAGESLKAGLEALVLALYLDRLPALRLLGQRPKA